VAAASETIYLNERVVEAEFCADFDAQAPGTP